MTASQDHTVQPSTATPLTQRCKQMVFGKPRDFTDHSLFHRLSLIPFLAWVGLGADGLSSSAYGPEEAFRALGNHSYLAVGLALMMAATVFIISLCYSRIIEQFPHGGGGYVVATKLLGKHAGVVSGCALLVDYVLTISISIAAAGDAIFSFMPVDPTWKFPLEVFFIVFLIVINIRGVKESVMLLMPIFILFIITHLILIGCGVIIKLPQLSKTSASIVHEFKAGYSSLGIWGMLLLFLHAYSLGGGTYTGIEAVSNGLPIMREPHAQTGKRTMFYMATSLAFTAAGLLLCYLLWQLAPEANKTMNAVLVENISSSWPGGNIFIMLTLFSEGMLLVVAAQAGFIDGPRVLSNMAIDSWVPRKFAALSERLTTRNGIVLMGIAALASLYYTKGNVSQLVVMYSINVFLTFSLSMLAMSRFWIKQRNSGTAWKSKFILFVVGLLLCSTILVITTIEKFSHGAWITVAVTSIIAFGCILIHHHYQSVGSRLQRLYANLENSITDIPLEPKEVDPQKTTAIVLVSGSYNGVGIHTVLNIHRLFPDFANIVFVSVAIIDSGSFKGQSEMDELRQRTETTLKQYVKLAQQLGLAATYRLSIGTEIVAEAEKLCLSTVGDFPKSTIFLGKVVFNHETWFNRLLHNHTAQAVQRRLEIKSKRPIVIVTARVDDQVRTTV